MRKFAENTDVNSAQSKVEIDRLLLRYGAKGFLYGWQEKKAVIAFEMKGRQIKFFLLLPDKNSKEFTQTPTGRHRKSSQAAIEAYEQAVNRKWRALALSIKAKLVSVDEGIETFEEAFLAHIALPNGQTTGSWLSPQIAQAYEKGTMPALLPLIGMRQE